MLYIFNQHFLLLINNCFAKYELHIMFPMSSKANTKFCLLSSYMYRWMLLSQWFIITRKHINVSSLKYCKSTHIYSHTFSISPSNSLNGFMRSEPILVRILLSDPTHIAPSSQLIYYDRSFCSRSQVTPTILYRELKWKCSGET